METYVQSVEQDSICMYAHVHRPEEVIISK